jgi:hypothetical protein
MKPSPVSRHALAIVIVTICRESLLRAVRSIFAQTLSLPIQVLIGVDHDPDHRASDLKALLEQERPEHIKLTWVDLGYSTSRRHGGPHPCYFGGSLRSALTFLADSEIVMYLDDDDWLAESHSEDILKAIEGKSWAFSYCTYADSNLSQGLCVDEIESVGVGKGVFQKHYNGFVRPSGLALNKLKLSPILHLWADSPFPTGDGEDRLIFNQLKTQPHGCTEKATVYYALDPKDGMHSLRVQFMRQKGIEFKSEQKDGSVR